MAETIDTSAVTETAETDMAETVTPEAGNAGPATIVDGADSTSADLAQVIADHRRACDRFTEVVSQGAGRWAKPSPCEGWDARDVVDHVIGFHDELLLQPTGIERATLPDNDPIARWAVTVAAIRSAATARIDGVDGIDLGGLLPALTAETLTHTWDLAMALGVDPGLPPDLCATALAFMRSNEEPMRASGLFGDAVRVPTGINGDAASQLVAFLGRDPSWSA